MFEEKIDDIVEHILNGSVVLLPTDTVYGLAIKPDDVNVKQKLYNLKNRPEGIYLPIMVAEEKQLLDIGVDINDNIKKILNSSFVPGPVSIAAGFITKPRVSWLEGRVEIAFRIPNDKRLLSLIRKIGPILVTSANAHGKPCCKTVPEILDQLNGKPDMIIDNGVLEVIPSTLVNCRVKPPVVERIGCVPEAEILKVMER